MMQMLFGDGRRMFANHFFVKADVYFHRGYYPSIFDQGKEPADTKHMTEEHDASHEDKDEEEHEKAMDFLGQPKDWIDAFGRHFFPSHHSHLDKPGEAREILPWLRISAELDPQRIETYVVAAFWLRRSLGKTDEAEQFLREGLKANPASYEILFELGKLYQESRRQPDHARNLWELALHRWQEQDAAGKKPDPLIGDAILANLVHVEEEQGNTGKALSYLDLELKVSPAPDAIQKRIAELKEKEAGK
jgi:tetratricopeptide (TPR) repeat protein